MQLELVPLLSLQRELYLRPRGRERFDAYLKAMVQADGDELRLPPLVAMNPMGKEHLTVKLDALLALDAEGVAGMAVAESGQRLAGQAGRFKVGLVVADDLEGGWTNRWTSEYSQRFEGEAMLNRGWISVILWSSEDPTVHAVREATLGAIFRAAYLQAHGPARTLGAMLAQEGQVMAAAGATGPVLEDADLERTRAILTPLLAGDSRAVLIPALFGDAAARELGYSPLGLPERAGLAMALQAARRTGAS